MPTRPLSSTARLSVTPLTLSTRSALLVGSSTVVSRVSIACAASTSPLANASASTSVCASSCA
eukprot:5385045-Prymnesium_polylepis.1